MSLVNLNFRASTLNASLQAGDNIHYTRPSDIIQKGGFDTTVTPKLLGEVFSVLIDHANDEAIVSVKNVSVGEGDERLSNFMGAYFSFSKSGKSNHNDLIGYYNKVRFVNNSKNKAELFSVGTEATENSK